MLRFIKKLLCIKEPSTIASTLQMLMSGPEYVRVQEAAGIYPQLLQYISMTIAGRSTPGRIAF